MEKSTDKFRKHVRRLLIAFSFIFTISASYAKNPTWDELRKLTFSKGQDYFFTATECPFYMNIENVRPENVQVAVNSLPDNVSFVASKKEVLMPYLNEDNEYVTGTKLIVWFKFAVPGTYRLRSIDIVINGGYYRLGFESVDVFENPRFILPELKIEFEDPSYFPSGRGKNQISVRASDHVVFTVYTRYSVRINNISWDIPKDSLFKQVRTFDTIERLNLQHSEDFSPDYYPIATFDWQPLVKGSFDFPSILILATAYNGSRYELNSPEYKVNVLASPVLQEKQKQASSFAYAFTQPTDTYQDQMFAEASAKNIQTLADLHSKERHSMPPFSDSAKKRIQFEEDHNLPSSDPEPKIPVIIILAVISLLIFLTAVLMILLKKIPAFISVVLLYIASLVVCLIYGSKIVRKSAVYKGGQIYPIPEQHISSGTDLPAGTVVTVVHSAGTWCYIRHNDTYGWITEDRLILIK